MYMGASPRLLWPSNSNEAHLELELVRAGDGDSWPGSLGSPPRNSRSGSIEDSMVALELPPPVPMEIANSTPPAGLDLRGESGRGMILFGRVFPLLDWLENLGENTSEACRAVRYGTGLKVPGMWNFSGGSLSLTEGSRLMAVMNITPDSFYAGSRYEESDEVEEALECAVQEGADILDIGGESTRPGAQPLPETEEIERVLPVIEKAVSRTDLPISVDTRRAGVARAALEAGAAIVNDISGGTDDPELLPLVAEKEAGLVIMHRQGMSATMQEDPRYENLMGEIYGFLAGRVADAEALGISSDRIVIDPGLGFGKRRQHNFEIYRRVTEFHSMGYPLIAGPSRKRHTSGSSDRPAGERLMGTAAACAILAYQGVQILRIHDVGEIRRALDTVDEIRGAVIEDRVS